MDLIERYIYAVVQRLPHSQRDDVAEELRGLIADMLDERTNGREAEKEDIREVLLELGHPNKMADNYRENRKYLIGPLLFDPFITVMKIVLISLAIALSVIFVIQTILEPTEILAHFIDLIIGIVQTPVMALGWVTIVFAMMEHFGSEKIKDKKVEKQWTPEDLPPAPDQKYRIKRSEPITNTIFTILFGFFVSSSYFGVLILQSGDVYEQIPFLNKESFSIYFPLILLIIGLGVLKEILKLVSGKWTRKLATQIAVVSFLSLVTVLIMIVLEPVFWNPNFMSELVNTGKVTVGTGVYETVENIWNGSKIAIVIIMIVGPFIDAVSGFIRARKK